MILRFLDATVSIGQLHDAFIGHERQRHDLIGYDETRTVGARSVLNTCIPVRLEFVNWRVVLFSSCAVNTFKNRTVYVRVWIDRRDNIEL